MRSWLCAVALSAFALPARADVELGRALAALRSSGSALPRALLRPGSAQVSVLLERTRDAVLPAGAVPIAGPWFALDVPADDAPRLTRESAGFRFHWSAPRRLLLDRARGWTRVDVVRSRTGLSGRGVVVGVIDSGVDVAHPDLRRADGSTRIAWFIDFARPPRGRHPELEAEYGCNGVSGCAVYSAADIDELVANGVSGDEPRDSFGHGTHVASLAAGNDRASGRYSGVAPEADLVIARVATGGTGILDADVLRGARFVFDRARDSGAPAVLNLSLGSDFGAHDGSSALERALSSLVGPDEPGRAIVVAAGNSAGLHAGSTRYPAPLGVHTEVHVPRHSPASVPLLTLGGGSTIRANVYVWLSFRPGDHVEVGLARNGADWISALPAGSGRSRRAGDLEATVLNGVGESGEPLDRERSSAAIVLEGAWPAETAFEIRLRGHGTASIWLQSDGDLDPAIAPGALLPFAFKEGTVNVPASAPELIAVGATLNRVEWRDVEGNSVLQAEHGSLGMAPEDTTAFFSSAGPNALGVLKPDIVAPGAHVIGAMSALADPRENGASLFGGGARCALASECFVIDDEHAITSGTSMAAPLVAGAVALLFERDPRLTQAGVRALLQAGARPLEGVVFVEQQAGVGALDVEASLAAAVAEESPLERVPSSQSWIALAAPFARPDPAWPLAAIAELRDASGALADGFDARRLSLELRGGSAAQPLTRVAPGLYEFAVAAPAGSGGGELSLELRFDGEVVSARSVPIRVDRGAATDLVTARGGCAVASDAPSRAAHALALLLLLGLLARRRA